MAACVTEPAPPEGPVQPRVRAHVESANRRPREPEEEAALFPPGLLPPTGYGMQTPPSLSPYHRYSHQTIRAPDGRHTRLYWLRAGTGPIVVQLVVRHTGVAEGDITLIPAAQVDPRPRAIPEMLKDALVPGVEAVSDLLTVTGTEDKLMEVDQFLSALLTEVPQIEIEAKVVEITSEDGLEVGVDLLVQELAPKFQQNQDGTQTLIGKGDDKSTPFKFFDSPLDPPSFLQGGQVGSLAVAFFENDIKFRAILRAIQESSNAEVLSQPKMAVLNGHRAIIDTGSRTPVLQPVLGAAGNLTQVQVRFEDTGIRLIVTPYLLMDDVIQIDVAAEVSFVSGFIESGATGILNPIISNRTASTVVNVRDGKMFAIGGLISTDQIELVTKIPILGDIPILGTLFKTKTRTEGQSQVIFFITPRLVRPTAPIFDPGA